MTFTVSFFSCHCGFTVCVVALNRSRSTLFQVPDASLKYNGGRCVSGGGERGGGGVTARTRSRHRSSNQSINVQILLFKRPVRWVSAEVIVVCLSASAQTFTGHFSGMDATPGVRSDSRPRRQTTAPLDRLQPTSSVQNSSELLVRPSSGGAVCPPGLATPRYRRCC